MSGQTWNVVLFIVGWILFVVVQAQNSIMSKSNGLPSGWAGFVAYFKLQAVSLAVRAFFSGILYAYIIQQVELKMQAAGLTLHAASVAGIAGFAASAGVYSVSGLLPWLRTEVSDKLPPPNAQVLPPPTPPSETRA